MGANNRRRRAAKQRKRARGRGPTPPRTADDAWWGGWGDPGEEQRAIFVDVVLVRAVTSLPGSSASDEDARAQAASVLSEIAGLPGATVDEGLDDLVLRIVTALLVAGWGPRDLAEVVGRRTGAAHLEVLLSALRTASHDPLVRSRWACEFDDLDPNVTAGTLGVERLATGLRLAALLAALPVMAEENVARHGSTPTSGGLDSREARQLAKVRALLAKAESTEYDDEAEALAAKAQSLITQHALHHLLDRLNTPQSVRDAGEPVVWRRLWVDPPYLLAKAMLVEVVAGANRSRSVVAESLGFCTIVGTREDLDAVELLVTSLLTQASRAMFRHGRHVDRRGVSRTRSFRQSFLVAYAHRIGERLHASSVEAVRSTGRESALLPVLRDDAARVEEAVWQMFPDLAARGPAVTNGLGWAAGHAAGDLALLDVHANLAEAASP